MPAQNGAAAPSDERPAKGSYQHLSVSNTIGDLLRHPAFEGFGHLLLPWDDRAYDESMLLRDIGSLLPHHSEVHPEVVVDALNRMIDDVIRGDTVFYDFDAGVTGARPAGSKVTGLFFLRGKRGAPFAVICPGGGFSYVGSVHEGFPYAARISDLGYNAFVLKYRVGQGGAVATEDLAAALSFIFRHAEMLGVSTEGFSLWGSSAGARMAASIGSHGVAAFGGDALPKPSTVVIAYTGHSDVATVEPPTFVVVGEDDGIAAPSAMERRVKALQDIGAEVEYRKFPNVGHGFGIGTGTSAEGWIDDAIRFWQRSTPVGK
jgi:acetyl esterase/lipase